MQDTADWAETKPHRRAETDDAEARFKTELFGFDRVEVLSYIEKISAANAEKARALEQTIEQLQQGISDTQQREDAIKQKARQVLQVLETQKKRAEDAVAEAAELRTEVDRANDEIAAVRSRLFAKEQENEALKNENADFSASVESLTRSLQEERAYRRENTAYGQYNADPELLRRTQEQADEIMRNADRQAAVQIERAKEQADSIIARATVEKNRVRAQFAQSADGIAACISVLKTQLTAVDAKILAATSDLQKATEGIVTALSDTQRSLSTLGAQTNDHAGIGTGYRSAQRSGNAWDAPSYTQSSDTVYDAQQKRDEEEYQRALYEVRREREQREAREKYEAERRNEERAQRERELREQEARRAQRERELREQEARRAQQERELREQEARRAQQERELQEQEYARRQAAYQAEQMRSSQYDSQNQPEQEEQEVPVHQMHNRVDYTVKKAEITGQEQYDAIQNASRGVQMPYDMPIGFEPYQLVTQKPSSPQLIEKKQHEDPRAFGQPHAPRAMPFTAFDPYTPHTAPYMDPNDEQARILNAPPAPPTDIMEEKTPYVPQPTPIMGRAPLERVQAPQPGTQNDLQKRKIVQSKQPLRPAQETPVIIPYSAPIPSSYHDENKHSDGYSKQASNGQRTPFEQERSMAQERRTEPAQRSDTRYNAPVRRREVPHRPKPNPPRQNERETEEDLLENLKAMLEG